MGHARVVVHGGGSGRSILTKGRLIAAGGIVVAAAAIIAFVAMRPDQPEPTRSSAPSTTTTSPTPGASPAVAAPAGPWLRGTYRTHYYGMDKEVTVTSDCPACDATFIGPGPAVVAHWNGIGWTLPDLGCGNPGPLTPTVVANGTVQEFSFWNGCSHEQSGTYTRIGG